MKKEDIKSGMVVKLRNGIWCLVVEYEGKLLLVNDGGCESRMSEYNDSLIDNKFDEYDIVAVAKADRHNLITLCEDEFNVVWERNSRTELTIEEIEEKLGFKIKIVK